MTSTEILELLIVALAAFAAGALFFHGVGRRRGLADGEPEKVGLQRDLLALQAQRDELKSRVEQSSFELESSRQLLSSSEARIGSHAPFSSPSPA